MEGKGWGIYRRISRWTFPIGALLMLAGIALGISARSHLAGILGQVIFWLGIVLMLSRLPLTFRLLFPPNGRSDQSGS